MSRALLLFGGVLAAVIGIRPGVAAPLSFEPYQGKSYNQVKYVSRANGYTLLVAPGEILLGARDSQMSRMRLAMGNKRAASKRSPPARHQ